MSTLNERQLPSEVGELSEPILAFTSLKREATDSGNNLGLMKQRPFLNFA
jgi:hypothetical protein